jgi:hypothetical protein
MEKIGEWTFSNNVIWATSEGVEVRIQNIRGDLTLTVDRGTRDSQSVDFLLSPEALRRVILSRAKG